MYIRTYVFVYTYIYIKYIKILPSEKYFNAYYANFRARHNHRLLQN